MILSSIRTLELHLLAIGVALQDALDRLHARHPHRVSKCRVDATAAIAMVPTLFNDHGRRYIGAYVHGIDCPTIHPSTIEDAIGLFEDLCFNGMSQIALHGGVSAGKSSVLHTVRLLLGALCVLGEVRYVPLLIQSKLRSASEIATDHITAYLELYGAIAIHTADGRRVVLGQYLSNLGRQLGPQIIDPVTSLDDVSALNTQIARHGLTPIALVDDADILPRYIESPTRHHFGPSVEMIELTLPKVLTATGHPELYVHTRAITAGANYIATQQWYRSEQWAAKRPKLLDGRHFHEQAGVDVRDIMAPRSSAGQVAAMIRSLDWSQRQGFAGAYIRLGTNADVERLRDGIAKVGVTTIICDRRKERTTISDACWRAHLDGSPFVLISAGAKPLFHRGLPPSIGLFLDSTNEISMGSRKGICAAACGYERAGNVVVLSDHNVAQVHQYNRSHRYFTRRGSLRLPIEPGRQWRYDQLARRIDDVSYDPLDDVTIDDINARVRQQGKFTNLSYEAVVL
jgi:hypothetical protein